jgi:hypothetical protein
MLRLIVLVALVAGIAGLAVPSPAETPDRAIRAAFEDVLRREPTDRELRRYRDLIYDEHWTERDVRDDLRRRSDYQRHSERKFQDPDRVVRRAYQDILDREPDAEGLRLYRSRMLDQDWTEQDVREALRKSPEYAQRSSESAERIVRRAYQDVLGREPDANGLRTYRDKVVHQGWEEYDVNEALRRSPEYRQKGQGTSRGPTATGARGASSSSPAPVTREQAEEIVRRAYLSVLERNPDAGSQGWVDRVMRERWTEEDLARELRKSDEYRSKQPQR